MHEQNSHHASFALHPCGDGVDETSTLFDLGKLSKNEQSLANHAEPEVTPMWGWGRFASDRNESLRHWDVTVTIIHNPGLWLRALRQCNLFALH